MDIQDLAETTLKELLGWYGLDSRAQSSPASSGEEDSGTRPRSCARCRKTARRPLERTGLSFCSEACLGAGRRTVLRRACDWCRRERAPLSSADFQEREDPLQFCGDRCLNQYKMHIFCRETQAYLQTNPRRGRPEAGGSELITPELWLREGDAQDLSPTANESSKGDEPTRRKRPPDSRPVRKRQSTSEAPPPQRPRLFLPQSPRPTPSPPAAHCHPPSPSPFLLSPRQDPMEFLLRRQAGRLGTFPLRPDEFARQPPSANTLMLPYPLFVPLPVPIPIPIPLSHFLTGEQRDCPDEIEKKNFPAPEDSNTNEEGEEPGHDDSQPRRLVPRRTRSR